MYTARIISNRSLYLLSAIITILAMVLSSGKVKAQTLVYAQYIGPAPANTGGTAGTGGAAGVLGSVGAAGSISVVNPTNLNDLIYNNFAEVKAQSGMPGSGVAPGSGGASVSYMNLNFTGAITPTAGNPVIIKLQAFSNTFGLLGSLFANALAQVTVQGYNGSTGVGTAIPLSSLVLRNADEYVFVPTASCTSLRITVTTDIGSAGLLGLLGGGPATAAANIYYAYVFDPTCNIPYYTTTGTGGVSLGANVSQPNNAIDGNVNTFSTLSFGVLGVGASVVQRVHFSGATGPGDAVTLTISKSAALLSLDLLNAVSVSAYNGTNPTPVWTASVGALLSLDLLGLLSNTAPYAVTIPGNTQSFNRVELTMNSVASVLGSLNLHEAQITPPKPTFTGSLNDTVYICPGNMATLTVDVPASGNEIKWYASAAANDITVLHTGATFITPALSATTIYWAATKKTACSPESERVPVRVLMNALPVAPSFAGPVTVCKDSTKTLTVTAPAANTDYRWYKTASGGTPFFTGNAYTTSALAADTTFYVDAYNTLTTCLSSARTQVAITVSAVPNTIAGDQAICSGTLPVTFTSVLPATAGSSTFQWQKSTDSIIFVNAAAPATGITYTEPTALAQTVYYRRTTTLNGCASSNNVVKVTVSPLPTITFNNTLYSCLGDNAVPLVYTNTANGPTQYSITWTGAPAGLANVNNATFSGTSGNISIIIQPAAAAGVYNAVLTVKAGDCSSTNYNFSLTLQTHPSVTPVGTSFQ